MTATDNVRTSRAPEAPSILSKAFDLLRAFDSANRVMTLSELARASGLPKSTVHRLLARLLELDAVEHHGVAGYRVGLGLLRLGTASPASGMRDAAMPFLTSLQLWTEQTVQLAVLRGADVVYLENLEPPSLTDPSITAGCRLPAHCTAAGKALLAHENLDDPALFARVALRAVTPRSVTSVDALVSELRRARHVGLAHELGEHRPGLAGIGAPILLQGRAVGAVSITHPETVHLAPKAHSALREAVFAISQVVRGRLTSGRSHWLPSLPRYS